MDQFTGRGRGNYERPLAIVGTPEEIFTSLTAKV